MLPRLPLHSLNLDDIEKFYQLLATPDKSHPFFQLIKKTAEQYLTFLKKLAFDKQRLSAVTTRLLAQQIELLQEKGYFENKLDTAILSVIKQIIKEQGENLLQQISPDEMQDSLERLQQIEMSESITSPSNLPEYQQLSTGITLLERRLIPPCKQGENAKYLHIFSQIEAEQSNLLNIDNQHPDLANNPPIQEKLCQDFIYLPNQVMEPDQQNYNASCLALAIDSIAEEYIEQAQSFFNQQKYKGIFNLIKHSLSYLNTALTFHPPETSLLPLVIKLDRTCLTILYTLLHVASTSSFSLKITDIKDKYFLLIPVILSKHRMFIDKNNHLTCPKTPQAKLGALTTYYENLRSFYDQIIYWINNAEISKNVSDAKWQLAQALFSLAEQMHQFTNYRKAILIYLKAVLQLYELNNDDYFDSSSMHIPYWQLIVKCHLQISYCHFRLENYHKFTLYYRTAHQLVDQLHEEFEDEIFSPGLEKFQGQISVNLRTLIAQHYQQQSPEIAICNLLNFFRLWAEIGTKIHSTDPNLITLAEKALEEQLHLAGLAFCKQGTYRIAASYFQSIDQAICQITYPLAALFSKQIMLLLQKNPQLKAYFCNKALEGEIYSLKILAQYYHTYFQNSQGLLISGLLTTFCSDKAETKIFNDIMAHTRNHAFSYFSPSQIDAVKNFILSCMGNQNTPLNLFNHLKVTYNITDPLTLVLLSLKQLNFSKHELIIQTLRQILNNDALLSPENSEKLIQDKSQLADTLLVLANSSRMNKRKENASYDSVANKHFKMQSS